MELGGSHELLGPQGLLRGLGVAGGLHVPSRRPPVNLPGCFFSRGWSMAWRCLLASGSRLGDSFVRAQLAF